MVPARRIVALIKQHLCYSVHLHFARCKRRPWIAPRHACQTGEAGRVCALALALSACPLAQTCLALTRSKDRYDFESCLQAVILAQANVFHRCVIKHPASGHMQ